MNNFKYVVLYPVVAFLHNKNNIVIALSWILHLQIHKQQTEEFDFSFLNRIILTPPSLPAHCQAWLFIFLTFSTTHTRINHHHLCKQSPLLSEQSHNCRGLILDLSSASAVSLEQNLPCYNQAWTTHTHLDIESAHNSHNKLFSFYLFLRLEIAGSIFSHYLTWCTKMYSICLQEYTE